MLSLAKHNIAKYQKREAKELLLTILYMSAEALTCGAIFVFGWLYFSLI
jgi:hypothetical protein